jgi:hypothetical protein
MPQTTFGEPSYPNQTFKSITLGTTKITATGSEINRAADPDSRYSVDTATQTLAVTDLNKVHYLNSATEFATTLPTAAAAAGCWVKFIVKAAPSGASYTVVTASSENTIKGHVVSSDLDAAGDGDTETTGADTITFVDSKAVAGDLVILESDGAVWYAHGACKAFDAITYTTAS